MTIMGRITWILVILGIILCIFRSLGIVEWNWWIVLAPIVVCLVGYTVSLVVYFLKVSAEMDGKRWK